MQILDNGNVLAGWSKSGYQSEHLDDGTLLEESGFTSKRYDTYRSYKYPFVGYPHEPPHMVVEVLATENTIVTAFYVSWNGATEVKSWSFYSVEANEKSIHLGSTPKQGFETTWAHEGFAEHVWVEGFDEKGESLGRTEVMDATLPKIWEASPTQDKDMVKVPDRKGWPRINELKDKFKRPPPQDVQFPAMIIVLLLAAVAIWLGRRRFLAPMLRSIRHRIDGYSGLSQEEMTVA